MRARSTRVRMKKNVMMANPPASTGEMTQERHCVERNKRGAGGEGDQHQGADEEEQGDGKAGLGR